MFNIRGHTAVIHTQVHVLCPYKVGSMLLAKFLHYFSFFFEDCSCYRMKTELLTYLMTRGRLTTLQWVIQLKSLNTELRTLYPGCPQHVDDTCIYLCFTCCCPRTIEFATLGTMPLLVATVMTNLSRKCPKHAGLPEGFPYTNAPTLSTERSQGTIFQYHFLGVYRYPHNS